MGRFFRTVLIASSALIIAACSSGDQAADTSTVTVPVSTVTPSPTPTASAAAGADQAFMQSITIFSGFWAVRSSDSANLTALGRTVCNWMGSAKQTTTDASILIPAMAVRVQQSMPNDQPPFDDAKQFVMSSLNFYCPGIIE